MNGPPIRPGSIRWRIMAALERAPGGMTTESLADAVGLSYEAAYGKAGDLAKRGRLDYDGGLWFGGAG